MNKVVARHDTLPYQIEFPSPVYTSAILGEREDICIGVGGGKRFGMPNIVIAVETVKKDGRALSSSSASASTEQAPSSAKKNRSDPSSSQHLWNVCSWLDLGDDIPWAGAKVPMSFVENGNGIDKQYLAMSHLDAISIIEYEKNLNFDQKALDEELRNPPSTKKLGKRDTPPAPKNAPIFLRRAARLPLFTDEENPDKKVIAIVRHAEQPKRLTDQLFFVCQDDSSVVMFRLKKKRVDGNTDGSKSSKKASAVESKKENGDESKKEQEDGKEETEAVVEEEQFEYEVYSYLIPSNELRMGTAHPTDMDARETASGIVLMIVCDDKKVRVALLPQAWHCLKVCKSPEEFKVDMDAIVEQQKKASSAPTASSGDQSAFPPPSPTTPTTPPPPLKPLAVIVRSLLVLTAEDMKIPFNVMRSTLRVGLLVDDDENKGDSKDKYDDESIIVLVLAYDSRNITTNTVMVRVTIVDKCLLALMHEPRVTPCCKGAMTNIMPLYDDMSLIQPKTNTRNLRPFPPAWLATTVEGTIVELVRSSGDGDNVVGNGNKDKKGSSASKSASSSASASDEYDFPSYITGHQRPYKPKRCPPHLAAVHQEPISSAAISLTSGLLVTVDIAQKARLSRLDHLSTIVSTEEEEDGKNAKNGAAKKKKKKAFDRIPLLFPLKSEGGNGEKSALAVIASLFAPMMVLIILAIAVLIAVAPQMLPGGVVPLVNGVGYEYFGKALVDADALR